MNRILLKLICSGFVFYPIFSFAGPLESSMTAYLVKLDSKGKQVLEKTETAAPGETIEYRLEYTNTGDTPLTGIVVNGPVPKNTKFIQGSNSSDIPHDFKVSIDDGQTWDQEPVKRLQKENGVEKTVVIPPDKYTHVRWIAKNPINPKQVQVYKYRVIVK